MEIVFIFSLVCLFELSYILAMVTSSILSLTAELNAQDARTLTREQVAALAALAQQIEWALQEREAAAQDQAEFEAQVAQFEADEFRALASASDREDFWVDQERQ
jgi:hypothetical protein